MRLLAHIEGLVKANIVIMIITIIMLKRADLEIIIFNG